MSDYGFIGLLGWIFSLAIAFVIVLIYAAKNSENNILRFRLDEQSHKSDDKKPFAMGRKRKPAAAKADPLAGKG